MNAQTFERFLESLQDEIEHLYALSGASRWNLMSKIFAAALYRGYQRRFERGASIPEAVAFLESLHIEDLGLAAACLANNSAAWEHFIATYKPVVERFSHALITDRATADEIVGSIWTDLYGVRGDQENRKSPLEHYHGRSSLAAWLRTVVARREADAWRATRKTESLVSNGSAVRDHEIENTDATDPDRIRLLPMLIQSLDAAIIALEPKDKLRLSYYYVQKLTLAEVATLIGEHESTVSRNLARARTEILRQVERSLRRTHRLSDDQVKRCFDYAVEDWAFDLERLLAQEGSG